MNRRFPDAPANVRQSLLERSADELAALIRRLAAAQTPDELDF